MWLWEMEEPKAVAREYAAAFAYMFAISLARMGNRSRTHANVQGGVVVGAIMLRVLLPHVDWHTSARRAPSSPRRVSRSWAWCSRRFSPPSTLSSRGHDSHHRGTHSQLWSKRFVLFFAGRGGASKKPTRAKQPKPTNQRAGC